MLTHDKNTGNENETMSRWTFNKHADCSQRRANQETRLKFACAAPSGTKTVQFKPLSEVCPRLLSVRNTRRPAA